METYTMGVTVRKKGNKYGVFINHKGRRKAKMVGDQKAAELVASKIRAKLALGEFKLDVPPPPPTFKEIAERWLESWIKTQRSRSTYDNYKRELTTRAYPRIGEKSLEKITRADIKEIISDVSAKGLSKNTIKAVIAPIRGVFEDAIDSGQKLSNPAAKIKRLLNDKEDRALNINPLTSEEVPHLLEGAAEYDRSREGSRYRDVFPSVWFLLLAAVRTGLRLGEVLGLQWGDIDFRKRCIIVRRQWTKECELKITKTKKVRNVDMSDQLCAAFQQAMGIRQAELALEGREFDLDEPVFRNSVGHRVDHRRTGEIIFKRCLLLAGLRQIRFHDLRHTFASLLLANGESLVYVKEQLGHHSIRETVDTYGHLIPGANRAAVNKLDPPNWQKQAATICNPPATTSQYITHEHILTHEKESVGGGVWGSNPPTRY
jgi:integrase